ncbi:MAG TPA: SDR family oxidoreductase [Xanthobacteraceae bacterium]|nr:SDR family oxidoreductase [Xanthobacteraceae bacterium]
MANGTLLITGAASGIGRAAALRMAGRMHIVAADRNGQALAALADELRGAGHAVSAIEVDISDGASVREMAARIARDVGPVDALFNNAGISRRRTVEETSEADWDAVIGTHVKGTFLCARAVLPGMCERRAGTIVNMSSDFAVMGAAGAAAYCAAKSAIYSLTKSMALEFAPYGIRVNALGPGPTDTPLLRSGRTAEEWAQAEARNRARVPMGRLGRPEEIATVLDFLLSDRSRYITGQIIHPNGGALSW